MQGEMKQKFCTRCGAPNPIDAAFCQKCGFALLPLEEPVAPEAPDPFEEPAAAEEVKPEEKSPFDQALADTGIVEEVVDIPAEVPPAEDPAFTEIPAAEEPVVETAPVDEGFTQAPPIADPVPEAPAFTPAPEQPAFDPAQHPYAKSEGAFTNAAPAGGFTQAPPAGGFPFDDAAQQTPPAFGQGAPYTAAAAPVPPKKKGKSGLIIGIIVGLLAVAGAVGAGMHFLGGPVEVDVFSHVDMSYDGYEGEGYTSLDFDADALVKDLTAAKVDESDARAYVSDLTLTTTPSTGLYNGDRVVVSVTAPEKAGNKTVNIKADEKAFTVSGLTDKPKSKFVGTWEATEIRGYGVSMTPKEAELEFSVNFQESGTVTATTNGEPDGSGTWTESGDTVTISSNGETMKGVIQSDGTMVLSLNSDIDVVMKHK